MKTEELTSPSLSGKKAALFCPLLLLAVYGLTLLSNLAETETLRYSGNIYLALIVLQFVIFLLPSFLFCKLRGSGFALKLNLRPVGPNSIGITLLCVGLGISGSWLVRMGQIYLFSGAEEVSFSYSSLIPEGSSFTQFLYIGLTFALIPAVCEEFLFRSVLDTEYQLSGFGFFTTAAVTSLGFAMLHFDLSQFPSLLWNGFLLSLLTFVTRSVFTAMAAHFLYNLYSAFAESKFLSMMQSPHSVKFLLFTIAVVFLLFLVFFLSECERLTYLSGIYDVPSPAYVTEREKNPKSVSERLLAFLGALFSPTMLLCIIIFVLKLTL